MIIPIFLVGIDNASRAEFQLDWIFQLSGREKRGHALLVFDGTHPEFIERIKATAELAFESFDMLIPASKDTPQKMASAIVRRNNIFLSAAEYCQRVFRCPFLFLEPECTPTNPQWFENIEKAYYAQPRRYLLTHLQDSKDAPRFPLPIGVFHMALFNDIAKLCADAPEAPWERTAGEHIVSKSTKSRAFQPLKIQDESDFSKVRPEAQVVTGDTSGAFIEHLRESGVHLTKYTTTIKDGIIRSEFENGLVTEMHESQRWQKPILHIREPVQPRVTIDPPSLPPQLTPSNPTCDKSDLGLRRLEAGGSFRKVDLRTKEGRAWKAAHANGNGHSK